MTTYINLKLTIDRDGDRYSAKLEHQMKASPKPSKFVLDLDQKQIDGDTLKDYLQRIRELKAGREELEKFGEALYDAVFGGAMGERFNTWNDDLPDETCFRLRLDVQVPELQALPWNPPRPQTVPGSSRRIHRAIQ